MSNYHLSPPLVKQIQSVHQTKPASMAFVRTLVNVAPMPTVRLSSIILCVHVKEAMRVTQRSDAMKLAVSAMMTALPLMFVVRVSVHQCVGPIMNRVERKPSVRVLIMRLSATAHQALGATLVHSVLPLAVPLMMLAQMIAAASTRGARAPAA